MTVTPPLSVAVIGDVHGCRAEFTILLDKLEAMQIKRIVCLGDFMDKGPQPLECLRIARDRKLEVVKANHEERHARWYRRESTAQEPGGKPNKMRPWHDPRDEEANKRLTLDEVEWIENLPSWIEVLPGWVVVHGGLQPGVALDKQNKEKVLRLRWVDATGKPVATNYDDPSMPIGQPPGTSHWTQQWNGPESVIYGHEAFDLQRPRRTVGSPQHRDGKLWAPVETWGIDTGCVHGGHLTALILPEQTIVQVKAKQVYLEPPHLIPYSPMEPL